MYKIGEFSRLGQVSTRMLRHYDQLGLLKPGQIDKFTGYRYYTIDQLARLHRILALRGLGLPLEQIAQLLEDEDELSVEKLRGMLLVRRADLKLELQNKHQQLAEVEARLRQIEQAGQPSPYEILIKAVPAQPVASIRQIVPTVGEMDYYCRTMYQQLYAALARRGITPLQPEITLYHAEEYTEIDLDVETAVAIQPKHLQHAPHDDGPTFRELPASELTAALIYEGPFGEMMPAILALLAYIGAHRHTAAGPMRELHLSSPAHDADGVAQANPVIELQVPIHRV